MNPDAVADTQAVVWYYFDRPRLTARGLATLAAADATGRLCISAVTLVELVYLEGRPTFPYPGVHGRLAARVADPNDRLTLLPLDLDVAAAVIRVPRAEVPELADRIIAATAVAHALPLVSADRRIRNSAAVNALVPVIW
jgi:PIN domain nuclease of toxin-antitoxin system